MKRPVVANSQVRLVLLAAAASASVMLPASAQNWQVLIGAAARAEYNDNYFITGPDATRPQAEGFTVSVIPFVAAARRTEASDLTALFAIGANKVWGISPSQEYLSGRFTLDGSLRDAGSTWSGKASYTRTPALQDVVRENDVLLALTYTDAAAIDGAFVYPLSDQWSASVALRAYANSYESAEGLGDPSSDSGYNASLMTRYAWSDRTHLIGTLAYSYYASDPTRSDVITAILGFAHQFSPQFAVSGSAGVYWSDITAKQDLPGLGTPVFAGETRSESGSLFGGSITYIMSENSRLGVRVAQGLAPSAIGTLSKNDEVSIELLHAFSDRVRGRLWGSYAHTTFPGATDASIGDKTYMIQAALTYQLAERWKVDAGYAYTRIRYTQDVGDPRSNIMFVSVGYDWPGDSLTGTIAKPADSQVLPQAGPLTLPRAPEAPGVWSTPTRPDSRPFDSVTLP